MAQDTAVTRPKGENESRSQLNKEQTSKAVRALLKHIAVRQKERAEKADKRKLITSDADQNGLDADAADEDDVFIWLILATKRHIEDRKRLKPSKIRIPHSLYTAPTASICLLTVDPQRQFKDVIADSAFPAELRKRITRVIGLSKLRAKFKSFESRRQLAREHDIFLADDRIIPSLPQTLGKVFYKGGVKRPVPVSISGPKKQNVNVKEGQKKMATPQSMADEITRALSSALVHLSPSTSTAVRAAKANWDEAAVVENIEAIVNGMVERFVPRGWKNIKSLHIKGPNTTGLPLWLADELWMDDADVAADPAPPEETEEAEKRQRTRKRKRRGRGGRGADKDAAKNGDEPQAPGMIADDDGFDDELDLDILLGQQRLKRQKQAALKEFDDDVVTPAGNVAREAPQAVVAAS